MARVLSPSGWCVLRVPVGFASASWADGPPDDQGLDGDYADHSDEPTSPGSVVVAPAGPAPASDA